MGTVSSFIFSKLDYLQITFRLPYQHTVTECNPKQYYLKRRQSQSVNCEKMFHKYTTTILFDDYRHKWDE